MGIRLIVEIWDHWQDVGLTAGERADLQIIAENANDDTRETWPKGGVHQPYILRRAGKSSAGWKNAVGKLMKKGVLNYAVRNGRELSGFPGQVAVYRLSPLCPDPPHDGLLGQCKREERVTSQVTHFNGDSSETGHLSGDPIDRTGHPSGDPLPGTGHLSGDPNPSSTTSSSTTSSSAPSVPPAVGKAQPRKRRPRSAAAAGENAPPRVDVEAICQHLADVLERTGSKKRPTITKNWRKAARLLIDEDGITVEQAQRAIDWAHNDNFWTAHILTPMKLREKYETLRRKATAEQRKRRGSVRDPHPEWATNNVEINL